MNPESKPVPMPETAVKAKPHLKIDYQDIGAVSIMVLLSLSANFSEYLPFALDKKYLIGALAAVLGVALIKYLQAALVAAVIILIVGANLPAPFATVLQYAPWVMTLTLTVLVILASLNKIRPVPKWMDPESDSEPFSDTFDGSKAMFNAITHGRGRSVRALLRQGLDANVRNRNGETALMYAASRNEDYIVRILLNAGADPSLKNQAGLTALKVAEEKHNSMASELLKHAPSNT